jgi:hypothetical protein
MTVNQKQYENGKILFCLVLCLLSLSSNLNAETIHVDRTAGGVVKRVILIPESEFTPSNVVSLTRRFLTENEGKFRMLMFYVFVSRYQADPYFSAMTTDMNYESWLHEYNTEGKVPYPMAETLAIGNSAAMRYRDRSGKVGRVVLQGEDTFSFRLNGMDFEVVEVGSRDIPNVFKDGPHDPISVGFALKTSGPLTEEVGKSILKFLAQETGSHDIGVSLRHDIWFILYSGGPIVNPFFETGIPPTKDEWNSSITFSCGLWANKLDFTRYVGVKNQ